MYVNEQREHGAAKASGLLAIAAAILFASCITTGGDTVDRKVSDSPWLTPSPNLRDQIEDHATRLPWSHGTDRIENIRWFATVGEPAYAKLLEMVMDPRSDVAGSALAALGATRDSRLVAPLHKLPWPENADRQLTLERARTLLRLGDWSEAPTLIAGLRDDDMMVRALCGHALFESTGERFAFDPRADDPTREAAVVRWEAWWQSRQGEGILAASTSKQ